MEWFYSQVKQNYSRISIIDEDVSYSYQKLNQAISEKSRWVQETIAPQSVVSIVSDYSFESIALFLALLKHKHFIVPIVSTLDSEIAKKQEASHCEYCIDSREPERIRKLSHARSTHRLIEGLRSLDHAGLVLFSSGSSGDAKAILHDLDTLSNSYQGRKPKVINTLIFLGFDHIGGIDTLFRSLAVSGTITIPRQKEPEHICALIERHRVTVLPSSPSFLNLIWISEAYKKYDLSSLEIIGFGAEMMPEALLARLTQIFPGVRLQQKFGTSETNAIRIVNRDSDALYFRIEDENIEYRIVDNELWLKSKTMTLGYMNPDIPQATEQGWFKTGDLVEIDPDGYIRIIGRKSDIINVGGQKVFPAEVEQALLTIPEISDCMVYGESNLLLGQSVTAEVRLSKHMEKRELVRLIRLRCKPLLEPYKIPTKVHILQSLEYGERFKKIRRKNHPP